MITPQALTAAVSIVVTFIAGILAARGLISKETQAYLVGPETGAFLGVLCTAILGGFALYLNRPHAQIQNAAALPQVDAVVTKPKTATEISVSNVVPSVAAASGVPGITQS